MEEDDLLGDLYGVALLTKLDYEINALLWITG